MHKSNSHYRENGAEAKIILGKSEQAFSQHLFNKLCHDVISCERELILCLSRVVARGPLPTVINILRCNFVFRENAQYCFAFPYNGLMLYCKAPTRLANCKRQLGAIHSWHLHWDVNYMAFYYWQKKASSTLLKYTTVPRRKLIPYTLSRYQYEEYCTIVRAYT
jgi:hypothetical protein